MILEVTMQVYGEDGVPFVGFLHKEVVFPEGDDFGSSMEALGLRLLDRGAEAAAAIGKQIETIREHGPEGEGETP